jgi:hypothetical protein
VHEDVDHPARLGSGEALSGDADDRIQIIRIQISAHAKRAPDYFRIAAEAAGPVLVGENRNGIGARFEIVVFGEQPP